MAWRGPAIALASIGVVALGALGTIGPGRVEQLLTGGHRLATDVQLSNGQRALEIKWADTMPTKFATLRISRVYLAPFNGPVTCNPDTDAGTEPDCQYPFITSFTLNASLPDFKPVGNTLIPSAQKRPK